MGKYWEPLIEKKREALRDPDWKNMRANYLTANIDDSNRSWRNEAQHARLTREMWMKAGNRVEIDFTPTDGHTGYKGSVPVGGCEYPYGNPYTVELQNGRTKFTSSRAALDYAVMLSTISQLTAILGHPKVVVEIGGGYGGLAVRGLELWPDVQWWDVDFSEMTEIAAHYVYHCRSWKKPSGYVDGPDGETFEVPKFCTLDGGALPVTNFVKVVSTADVVINTRSMMEMDLDEVNWYLGAMQQWLRPGALFYCLNREKVTRMRDWAWDDRWACVWRERWPTNPNLIEMLLVRAGRLF